MYKKLNEILEDTESLQVKGATNVAETIIDVLSENKGEIAKGLENKDAFIAEIKNIAKKLAQAQPTETMAQNVLGFLIFELQEEEVKSIEDCKQTFDAAINKIRRIIDANETRFNENGSRLLKSLKKDSRSLHILTHCHSSGVRKVLEAAKKEDVDFKVFNTETRPVFLGRAAAQKMIDGNIEVTMIIDSAAPFVISGKSGPEFYVDAVFMGCDAITIGGAAANKIGSYGISLAAFYNKKPVYVIASLLKVKKGLYNIFDIPMETRSFREVWQEAPERLNVVNFAFDIIPSNFITGFITEFGILKPEEIREAVRKNYPRLM